KSSQGKTRESLASVAGVSHDTIHKAKVIAARADDETKARLRSGDTSINAEYKKIEKEAKAEERKSERAGLIVTMPSGKYAVILADPPWQYKNSGFNESAESQYQTMSTEDICAMAGIVNGFSTPETVIFMWATNPLLPDALKVMAAWGYEYKTNMAWIKDQGRGRGWFLKSKHELILIGTRANTPHPKERPDSCFEADRGPVHSRKPQAIYDIIESMYDGAKLEMFCREPHKGWVSHGNEL
ncbi:MAG: MT-A70 family methyltransferase, partial [Syntrophales bacterium]|nr:MT-A70 family methyltransferase [Syntrophales bacterium]